jgi:hypothetical protein
VYFFQIILKHFFQKHQLYQIFLQRNIVIQKLLMFADTFYAIVSKLICYDKIKGTIDKGGM